MGVERGEDGRCYLGDGCYPGHCTWQLDDQIAWLDSKVESLRTQLAACRGLMKDLIDSVSDHYVVNECELCQSIIKLCDAALTDGGEG